MSKLINCPTCNSLLVFPRGSESYCEDCGWPDEDFGEVYSYPQNGERLEKYQPNLQFFNERDRVWVPSGVITATMRDCFRGLYRYPTKAAPKGAL